MVASLVGLLLYGLYTLLQPQLVILHQSQVAIQTFLGKPIYELQQGHVVTLGGPFFKSFRFLKRRVNQTLVEPRDLQMRPHAPLDRESRDTKIAIVWTVTDPWRVATQIGVPVDWADVGEKIVAPAVLNAARTSRLQGTMFQRLRRLEGKAKTELSRRDIGLDIMTLAYRDKSKKENTPQFGPAQRFSRHLKRPELDRTNTVEEITTDIEKIFSPDKRLVKVENLAIQYAIVEPDKFKKVFGSGSQAAQSAKMRISFIVKIELITKIASRPSGELDKLDPFSIVPTGGPQFKKVLKEFGIVIVDVGGEHSTYHVSRQPQ